MWDIVSILVAATFTFLSGLHFYWALFGITKPELVLPTTSTTNQPKLPGPLMTAAVAVGLLFFAAIFINQIVQFWNYKWLRYITITIGLIFIVRCIGDFKYVGFFKSITETPFSKMDTKYYSPLCFILGTLILLREFLL